MRCPTMRGNYCKRLSSCDDYTYSWNGAQQADFGYTKVSWEEQHEEEEGKKPKTETETEAKKKKHKVICNFRSLNTLHSL